MNSYTRLFTQKLEVDSLAEILLTLEAEKKTSVHRLLCDLRYEAP